MSKRPQFLYCQDILDSGSAWPDRSLVSCPQSSILNFRPCLEKTNYYPLFCLCRGVKNPNRRWELP
jgi:hypothetical protein